MVDSSYPADSEMYILPHTTQAKGYLFLSTSFQDQHRALVLYNVKAKMCENKRLAF